MNNLIVGGLFANHKNDRTSCFRTNLGTTDCYSDKQSSIALFNLLHELAKSHDDDSASILRSRSTTLHVQHDAFYLLAFSPRTNDKTLHKIESIDRRIERAPPRRKMSTELRKRRKRSLPSKNRARARGSSIGVLDPRPFSRFHERSIGSPLTFSWRKSSAKRGTSLTFEIIRARNTHACVAMHSTTT